MKAYRKLLIAKIIKGLEENYKDAILLKSARHTPETTFETWEMFFMTKNNGKGDILSIFIVIFLIPIFQWLT